MKKFFISLNLILLAHFFTINFAYCEEDFFSNSKFEKSKAVNSKNSIKDKINIFSKFKKDSNKEDGETKGYYGTLPNISRDFAYKNQSSSTTNEINAKIPTDEELQNTELKSAPYDDALFLDVIVKKEKASNYVNDIQKTKFALNNLKKCIEEQGDIQRFNGCVNVIDLLVQNLKNKYQDKSEAYKESYADILNTNYYAKILGNLMYDANYYSRYVPTSQGKYSKENIQKEQQALLVRINKTIFLINNES